MNVLLNKISPLPDHLIKCDQKEINTLIILQRIKRTDGVNIPTRSLSTRKTISNQSYQVQLIFIMLRNRI